MTSDFINQILNNFLEVSKFYLKVSPLETGLYTIPNTSEITITTSPPNEPYYLIFNNTRILKMAVRSHCNRILIDEKTLSKADLILLLGAQDLKNRASNLSEMLSGINYYAICYITSQIQKDDALFSFSLHRLGLTKEGINILEKIEDEKAKIFLSKIYRETNNIKKSLDALSLVKSKEFEPHKNIEYAWLHLQTGKPQNSIKIFQYYRTIDIPYLKQEVLYGLAKSMYDMVPQNLKEILDLLKEAKEAEGIYGEDILKKMAEIYLQIKNPLLALKIYQDLYTKTLDVDLLPDIILLSKENNKGIELVHDLAIFKPDIAKDLIKDAEIPPNPYISKHREEEQKLAETQLVPEDITKSSRLFSSKDKSTSGFEPPKTDEITPRETSSDPIEMKAFEFSKNLEMEFSKRIYFNLDGVDELERKLRITFMSNIREDKLFELFENASFFLLYIIRERFKPKIYIYENLDLWTTTLTIKNKNGLEITTYPLARIWRFRWEQPPPPHGYLRRYVEYLISFMDTNDEPPYGKIAVTRGVRSHDEKIFDAKVEHKKILEVAKDIEETSNLTPNSSLLGKFESELRKYFKPQIPPTIDGWKILRCFAHIFLEMILKDFSPEWFCVERNDGLWSFLLPNKTYIFPIGKVYKAALGGESLQEYYNILLKNLKTRTNL